VSERGRCRWCCALWLRLTGYNSAGDHPTHQARGKPGDPDNADEVRAVPGWLSSLRDLIADASPLRRFMLALLVLLPLAALASAYLWFNPPAYRVLYTQLSDARAARSSARSNDSTSPIVCPRGTAPSKCRPESCMRHAIVWLHWVCPEPMPMRRMRSTVLPASAPRRCRNSSATSARSKSTWRARSRSWIRSNWHGSTSPCPRSRRSCAMRRPPPLRCWYGCVRAPGWMPGRSRRSRRWWPPACRA